MLAPKKAISLSPSVVTPLFWRSLYVSTNENIADCMTKNNYYPAFKKFRAAMGVA